MAKGTLKALMRVGTLLGSIVLGAAVVQAPAQVTPSTFPPLDPAQVECTAFQPASYKLCYTTANDLHQLFELIVDQLEADDLANAEQETLPTTPIVLPDGTVVHGLEEFGAIAADFVGSNDFTFGPISFTFRYRPLDPNTVVAFGIIDFTIEDHEHGTIRVLSIVQTQLFRRNQQMPRGWEQVYEQHAYRQSLLGQQ
jgi:hypothetical protein